MKTRKVIIGDICVLNSETITSSDSPEIIQYIDTSSITKNRVECIQVLDRNKSPFPSRAKRKVKNGTIIYSTVRPNLQHFGYIENSDKNLIVSTGFLTLDVKDKDIDPKYLYYSLTRNSITNYLHNIAVNNVSSYPSINPDDIGTLELEVPEDIRIQTRIASVLTSVDSKIELNDLIVKQLESLAKTIYEYWFIQFDFPDKDAKPYRTSGGKMVWNDKIKKNIPYGWKVGKISDWFFSDKSGDWGKDQKEGNFTRKVTCIRGTDIIGLNGFAELKPPLRYILEKNSLKILNSHDLIIEISGGSPVQSTGRIALITDAIIRRFENPLICSNFCKPITIKNKKLLYNFFFYWNSLYDAGIFFGYEGKTSGIKNFLFDCFVNSHYTVIPDENVAEQFYNMMDDIQKKKQNALAENQKLVELRDWLLPMLINGQVRVK